MEKGISVVLLAYKEEENLRVLIPQILVQLNKTGEKYEIIVVDTKQPLDNTEDVCRQHGCVYINQEAPGFGGAFKTGIKYARMDKFLILDSDCSHDPAYIPAIYEKFMEGDYDVVIGSRYTEGGSTCDKKSSVIMSHILNFAFRLCLGIKAKDISTDYRMYKTDQLKQVELTGMNYNILEEVLLKIKLNCPGKKIRIGEVPISFNKRVYGESKRRLLPFILDYARTLISLTWLRIRS